MMGFTFVTDCASCSRLLSTSPRGNAVAGAFSAKRLNWLDEFSPHGFRVSESHLGFFFIPNSSANNRSDLFQYGGDRIVLVVVASTNVRLNFERFFFAHDGKIGDGITCSTRKYPGRSF